MRREEYYEQLLQDIEKSKLGIKKRELKNGEETITFLYVSQIVDKNMLNNDIIKPISLYILENKRTTVNAQNLSESIIYSNDFKIDDEEEKIIEYILKGMVVTIFSSDSKYLAVNIKKVENRGVNSPELTFTLRGPRDSLSENLEVSLSLIRYRIKDQNLNINMLEVGRRTKTGVAILHIGDIANDDIVQEITERIKKIDVDGIIDSGEIQNLILNRKASLFPQMGVVERSDTAAGALLKGKVLVLVEGSALAIEGPKVFDEYFESCEDNYDNRFIAVFAKSVRVFATILSVTITALYVAILNFHPDALPAEFIVFVSNMQKGVPFSAFMGIIILEVMMEMLRESLIRVPKQIGPAIGIVGAVVIGQAAISAKLFSPLALIAVSVSLLSSFATPDYTIMNPLRIVKLFLIIASACFGLVGFTVGISMIIMNILSANSFGIPLLAPIAPFNSNDIKRTFLIGKDVMPKRAEMLKTKDKIRSSATRKQ